MVANKLTRTRGLQIGLLCASAVLSGLAHPPLGAWGLILLAPAPLFGLTLATCARVGFAYGWLWSFLYYLTLGHPLLYLIELRTGSVALSLIGMLLVAGLGALFGGLYGVVASQMGRTLLGIVGAAGAWALTQYLRGQGPFAFVWGHCSVALYPAPMLLQPAELVGAWGMEFLIALWNGLLSYGAWLAVQRRYRPAVGIALATLLGAGALLAWSFNRYGEWGLLDARLSERTRLIALVQPNVDLARPYTPDEWTPIRERIADQVRRASTINPNWRNAHNLPPRPDLMMLPEVIEPYPMPESRPALLFWRTLAMETRTALLVGGYRTVRPDAPQVANTMFLFLPNGDWQYHDKVQLVPLGEYVPYREWLPFLRIFGVVESDLYAGDSLQPLQAGDMRIGAVICMESTYPWIARGLANAGANLLAVGSNESWFGRTAALEQHLAFCVLRAIETRRWIARCAPEGISAFIAPTGAIRARAPKFAEAILDAPVHPHTTQTLYMRWGDWAVGMGVALIALAIAQKRRRTP
jgi:apolipoprotein N-acyltransferase